MKTILFLILLLCPNTQSPTAPLTNAKPTAQLFTGDYIGDMLVGTDFKQENVRVTLSANGDVTLHKVKFAKLMPFKVTTVIPGLPITAGKDESGKDILTVTCDSVIPRVGNTDFPSKMATQVRGTSDGKTLSFSALFGGKPLTFTGSR